MVLSNSSWWFKMDSDISLNNVGSLLTRFALQIRELSQKKSEYNQQVQVFRTDIVGWRSRIESLKENIKKLEEEIQVKQSSVKHSKAVAQGLKVTNSRILQYEQTLKAELESRRTSYNDDTKLFEERITSYRKTYQSHKDYYCENPLAQKLLKLQAENEEIEERIKACDEQIMMKQKELDLRCPAVTTLFVEKLPDSVCEQQPPTETQEQSCDQTGSDSIDQKVSVETCAENIHKEQQETTTCCPGQQEKPGDSRLHKLAEHSLEDEMQGDEQEKETESQDKILQPVETDVEEAAEVRDELLTSNKQDNEGQFSFTFSPASSSNSESSEIKPSAPLFFMSSTPNTPCFSGFGFDTNSLQDEEQDTTFAFTSSLFDKKDTTEKKSQSGPEFLFGQSEQGEDFQFAFNFQSPGETSKDKNKEDFVFPFNF
ncbi:protein SIX6OS1 isoform X2 [Cynoglossus semilaevis]|uniref:protein SIX6OS1 isoform X2 n=1 Tax=Cynoglossus semilaevis TaxID=244447 RepID=UPI0007DCACC5|nr:protein SIX6OS1 isoform X2 [Cynoglossus semilaevis]